MTEVRNVYKNQIVSEDIALGVGKIQQTRRGVTFEGSRINMPVPVYSYAEMSRINPNVTNRVLYEASLNDYLPFIYSATATVGVPSNEFPGRWVPQRRPSEVELATSNSTALSLDGNAHNKLYRMTSATDVKITVGLSNRDIGFGPFESVPSIIFITAAGDGKVELIGDSGVTINTPRSKTLFTKNSTVALISTSVNTWLLIGDLEVDYV